MSGIAGIIRFDGAPVERGLVETMTGAMPYRGPDGINHWVRGPVALGQCMLRTTPESLEETQPLANEDESLVLVLDGRVDNWEELRSELLARGARLRTRADAELVLRAYEIWGEDCLAQIDGDFALVIWDARRHVAFCARDRMGNKPFTYHWKGKVLAFASELHAILTLPWVPQVPNEGMIAEFLADEWYTVDETLWTGVMRLPAAHRMSVGPGGPQPACYWEPDLWTELPYTRDEEYIEHYRELFADCVRRTSRSHKPVAYEVSGGLDSSAVFCMAEHLRREGRLPAPSIDGYTFAFEGYSTFDDLPYARSVGKHLGVPIHEVAPSVKNIEWLQDQALLYQNFPGYVSGSWNLNIFASAASAGSRVLLRGDFGDHYISGSRAHFAEELALFNWATAIRYFSQDAAAYGLSYTFKLLLRSGLQPLVPESVKAVLRPLVRMLGGDTMRNGFWLSPEMRTALKARGALAQPHKRRQVRRYGQRDLLQTLYYPFECLISELCERTSAAAGFEIRHPFNARAFVQFAFQTPERLRSRVSQGKYIHINALDGILPDAVRKRTTKAEGAMPIADYIRPFESIISMALPQRRPTWVSEQGMKELFEHYLNVPEAGWQPWVLLGILGCDLAMPHKNW